MHEPDVVQHCYVRRNTRPKRLSDVCYHSYTKQDEHTPIQTDDEEATKALAKPVSRRIGIPTFTSPGYSSGSLGHTQRFIQTLWAQLRTLRTQMGDKYSKLQIPTTHPIVGWAIRHASWILTRYLRHADGKTSYERRWQRPYASPLCIFGETVVHAEQMKVLPKHAIRFNLGIWVGRCTISNAHLVVDGNKLFRTRTVRRFPEGSERWNHETMQRFAVNVANPTSIPDVPSRRRDVSEPDELNERLDERKHAEKQRHVQFDDHVQFNDEPSRTESDHHKKRKRDPDDNGINVRRKYDEEDAEMLVITLDPQYIGHDEWILQESYVEPIQVFPILHEPKLDATRTVGINEELVSKAMKAEMESFRKFDVYDEVDIDDLTPEERSKIIGGRWVLTPKSDTVVKARYVAQGYAQHVEPDDVCATTLSPTTLRLCLIIAIQRRYHMQTWDVSTAFLHATRSEEEPIYIRPPMEFYDEESTIWRVKRAVYGLKTSPREWQDCFATTMTKKLRMTRSRIDANLFTKIIGNKLVMLLVYHGLQK